MPFTPSHAIVALPFVRTPLVPAAIAVGAMTPDLPLFTRGIGIDYGTTHDLRGIPLTTAIALALLLVWRLLLRPACRPLAPLALAARLPQEWDRGARATLRETFPSAGRGILLLVALALGVASHILWDAFTHEGRLGSVLVPALGDPWGPLPGYKWLQHGSSIGGVLVLAITGLLWLRGRASGPVDPEPAAVRIVWWLSLPALLVPAILAGLVVYGPPTPGFTAQHLAYRTLPVACGIWAALTIVLVIVLRIRRAQRQTA
ncbi:DUF4184 family protein [Microbacterium sp. ASV81]|uniref:DUF4184 family protein n=1 Tax=Microbacterium capsulatum TaxID=3041921 RepID=A0ABU0XL65_9MICO|nr:DUF4184 family protein [Microbacterium sp. ASV81]MDQ4215873.1 DUF4184 family protein [Microbacterium sp. ASV81]